MSQGKTLQVLRRLMDYPYGYTKKDLANQIDCSPETIKRSFEDLRNAGFEIEHKKVNGRYKYGFEETKLYENLKDLFYFTDVELAIVLDSLRQTNPGKPKDRIIKKLQNFYDYKRLNFEFLRKSHLDKIDALKKSHKTEQVVCLKNYHSSNSNKIADRLVECFHIAVEEDMMHAFDLKHQTLRNFRISRIEKVELTDQGWSNKASHNIPATDDFRIVDNHKVFVHLQFHLGAKNDLVERFPRAKRNINVDSEDETIFNYEAKVNATFKGITNFILNNHHLIIDIIEPAALRQHLQTELQHFLKKI